jgi:hypothetical protein
MRLASSTTLLCEGIQRYANRESLAIEKAQARRQHMSKLYEQVLPLVSPKTSPMLSDRWRCLCPKCLRLRSL